MASDQTAEKPSYFPITVQWQDTMEEEVIHDPEDIAHARGFKVIAVQENQNNQTALPNGWVFLQSQVQLTRPHPTNTAVPVVCGTGFDPMSALKNAIAMSQLWDKENPNG